MPVEERGFGICMGSRGFAKAIPEALGVSVDKPQLALGFGRLCARYLMLGDHEAGWRRGQQPRRRGKNSAHVENRHWRQLVLGWSNQSPTMSILVGQNPARSLQEFRGAGSGFAQNGQRQRYLT